MNSAPQAIGRYTVQGVLGRGAMGVVYLAMDPLLKRLVAIKTLRDMGEEDVTVTMERFHREAEISARLNHPNIITVFDVGSDPKVGPFLAMEYIEGASLSALIKKGLLPDAGMRLLIQGMSALMAAEQGGIIHRDIKSENMLISRDGRLKLMDFGIARRNESRLTQAGMVFGTPSYTAPELLVGGEPSAGTDCYAFSVTAFEVITGQLPFLGSSVASTLYKVVNDPPDLPLDMDGTLKDVFIKALAKEPSDRYPDLPSFMLALAQNLPLAEEQRARLVAILVGDAPVIGTGGAPTLSKELFPEIVIEAVGEAPQAPPGMTRSSLPSDDSLTTPLSNATPKAPAAKVPPTLATPPTPLMRFRWLILGGTLAAAAIGVAAWQLAQHPTHPLVIKTDPPGAEVFLNGEPMGRTPLGPIPIRTDRARGLLRVELKGYETLQEELEDDDRLLEYSLQRVGYEIHVVTDPQQAEVLLNGEPKGKSPLLLSVPGSGTQELVLKLEGFEDWKAELDRDAAFPATIRMTPASFLAAVNSDPRGAEVWLAGRNVGKTPLPSLQISGSGSHEVVLKLTGYEDWKGTVAKGTPLPRSIRMQARLNRIEIKTVPPGAELVLNGKPAGTSPATLAVPVVGTHTIRATLDGYEPRTVVVEPRKPFSGPIQLVPVKKAETAKPKDEKKPGFFKRLFGGGSKPEEKPK